jgi:sulfur relay (sulfurtransferase) complex TusBCD TusD component (DsrE family)
MKVAVQIALEPFCYPRLYCAVAIAQALEDQTKVELLPSKVFVMSSKVFAGTHLDQMYF